MRAGFGTFGLAVLAGALSGCGGGTVTPDKLPAEQQAPDYGKNSQDEMNKLMPKAGPGGAKKG